ncbi:endostatin-like outer membrane lipoprotein LenD, partial [Leptospira interrogans]
MKSKFKFVAVLTLTGILFLFSCSETQDGSDNTLFTLLSLLGEKNKPASAGFHYGKLTDEDPSDVEAGSENLLPSSPTYIFLAPAHHGGLGGIYGADEWCMRKVPADLKGSPYYSYKALLADGINRRASVTGNAGDGQINWVLQASTVYSQATTGTPTIGTTNSKKLFTFPLTNKIRPDSITDFGSITWTGLNPNWTTAPYNCNNWTDGADINVGTIGNYNATSSNAIFDSALIVPGLITCSSGGKLYCVEQPAPPIRFFKYIYLAPLSPIGHNGNYGGIAGMDTICNNDTMKPVELL